MFWRIYLHSVGLLALVLLASFALGTIFGRRAPWRRRAFGLARYGAELCRSRRVSPPGLAVELTELARVVDAPVTCYTWQGRLIASGGGRLPPLAAAALRERPAGPLPWRVARPAGVAAPFGAGPRGASGQAFAGYVLIGWPRDHDDPLVHLLLWLPVVLLVLAVGSIPLLRAILAPLERVTRAARAVAAGDLTARAELSRADELGELARSFDRMVARVEQLLRHEKELLANVSHELRTPLARLRVALELAEIDAAAATPDRLRAMGTDLAELEQLVDDLLTSARLELAQEGGGLPPLRPERLGVAALVDGAAQRCRARHPAEPISVVLDERVAQSVVVGDAVLLRRVLDNLLANALEHGGAGRGLTLGAQGVAGGARSDAMLELSVRDYGRGIAVADLPHVFEPFFRGDRSRSRHSGGVGLGLSLCRRIVLAHHGTITAECPPEGGTLVRVTLPATAPGYDPPNAGVNGAGEPRDGPRAA
ncbi:MAG: HAMP domain-containing histidine kinase [Proteobacteria bacterium]|nr:HAMP domain-containing histidine kinase [Pseudomonadota bacterium]